METYTSSVYQQQLECLIKLSNSLSYGFRRQPFVEQFNEYNFSKTQINLSFQNESDKYWEMEAHTFFEKHGIYDEFPNLRKVVKEIAPEKIAYWFPHSSSNVKRLTVLWSVLFSLYDYTQEIEMIEHGTVENDCLDQIEEVISAITGNCSETIKEPRSILRAFNDLGLEFKKIKPYDYWINRWAGSWRIWLSSLKVERDLLRKKILTGKNPDCNIIFPWCMRNSGKEIIFLLLELSIGSSSLFEIWNRSELLQDIKALSNCIIIYQNAIASCIQRNGKLNLIYSLCEQFGISPSEGCEVIMQMRDKAIKEMEDKCTILAFDFKNDLTVLKWINHTKGLIDGMAKYHEKKISGISYQGEMETQSNF